MQAEAAQDGIDLNVAVPRGDAIVLRLPSWIESPPYDLLLLTLVPLIPVPVLLIAPSHPMVPLVVGLVLAFAHYMSTFTFYAWDEYRDRHRSRWPRFFGGPALIVALMLVVALGRIPLVVPVVLFFWNVVHVARQSSGVLSIYRHRAGVTDPEDKRATNAALLSVCLFLSLYNIETHRQVYPVLTFLWSGGVTLARIATGGVAVWCLGGLVSRLWQRAREGRGPQWPERMSLLCGLTLFHPYLWIADSAMATGGMLIGHYVQYMSLVWLVHHRRFPTPSGSPAQRALSWVSARRLRIVGTLLTVGLGFLGAYELTYLLGVGGLFEAMYLTVALVHFYLDGCFWAFKDPSVRRSLGPFLVGFRAARPAA